MRIAIAGGFGLGYLLAIELSQTENAHNVIVLSRMPRREFVNFGIQVHVVDYNHTGVLRFALQGVDLVISTVSGQEQLNLINAAGSTRVRYFVPSEFEGSLSKRPPPGTDPLDRGSLAALALLRQWGDGLSHMTWTVFSCGLFMERFHPYGLAGCAQIGTGEGVANSGSYVADVNAATADYAPIDSKGHPVQICMTSVFDVVKFVIAAMDLGPANWPTEYTMRGDKRSLQEVVDALSAAQNVSFESSTLTYEEVQAHIVHGLQTGGYLRVAYLQRLLETARGRYDFDRANLNDAINKSNRIQVQPLTFAQWLAIVWT